MSNKSGYSYFVMPRNVLTNLVRTHASAGHVRWPFLCFLLSRSLAFFTHLRVLSIFQFVSHQYNRPSFLTCRTRLILCCHFLLLGSHRQMLGHTVRFDEVRPSSRWHMQGSIVQGPPLRDIAIFAFSLFPVSQARVRVVWTGARGDPTFPRDKVLSYTRQHHGIRFSVLPGSLMMLVFNSCAVL